MVMADPFDVLDAIAVSAVAALAFTCGGLYVGYRYGNRPEPEQVHAAGLGMSDEEFGQESRKLEDAAMWTDAARRAAGRDLEWEPDGKRANDMLCRGMTSTDLLVQANGRAFVRLFRDRAKELCGWDASRDGVRFSPYIARKLVDEALRTGRWQELPDYLQGEYHELAGDGISWAGDWMTDEVRAEALAIYGKDRYG